MKITRALLAFVAMMSASAPTASAKWIQTASVSFNEHDYFGRSVALSSGLLAVGSPYTSSEGRDSGAVHFYKREEQSKKKKGHELSVVHEIFGDTQGVELGFAVDVSDDSKSVIIASPLKESSDGNNGNDHVQPGSVKVYRYSDTLERWDQMGQELNGYSTQGEHFGRSVAISNDGLVIIIGAPKFDVLRRGRAAVYEFNAINERWIQKGQDLEGHVSHAQYGAAVDIVQRYNDDDDEIEKFYIAVGGPQAKRGKGIVQVFHYDEEMKDWNQVGDDIIGARFQDQLGHSLSLGYSRSKDYLFMAAGSPSAMSYYDEDDTAKEKTHSHVQVFGFDASDEDELGIWDRVGDEVRQLENVDGTGKAVVLSRDGLRLVVGSPEYAHDQGAVRIFDFDDEKKTYVQVGDDIYGEEESGFGFALSLSGLDIAVGSPYKNNVKLFKYDGNTLYTGSDSKRGKSDFSGIVKFILVAGLVGVISYFVVKRVRRRQHSRVETEEHDEWPFPFFSSQDRERIAEVRRLEAHDVQNGADVDRVVLHGMVRGDNSVNSANNNDEESSGSSESDDSDDISHDDSKDGKNIV